MGKGISFCRKRYILFFDPIGQYRKALIIKDMAYFKKVKKKINNKWYPQGVTLGKPVTLSEISKRLAELSSMSQGDVYSIMKNLGRVMGDYMNQGRTVKFDGVGTFFYTPCSKGNGVDTEDEVNARQITATKVRFIPETLRGNKGQVVSRSLVDSNVFWELLDLKETKSTSGSTTEEGGGTETGGEEQEEDPLA